MNGIGVFHITIKCNDVLFKFILSQSNIKENRLGSVKKKSDHTRNWKLDKLCSNADMHR